MALSNSANAFALQSQNLSNMQATVIANAQIAQIILRLNHLGIKSSNLVAKRANRVKPFNPRVNRLFLAFNHIQTLKNISTNYSQSSL